MGLLFYEFKQQQQQQRWYALLKAAFLVSIFFFIFPFYGRHGKIHSIIIIVNVMK